MNWLRHKSRSDLLGGGVVVLLGLGAIVEGSRYTIGTLARMGPGFFPVALGVLLVGLGILIALTADPVAEEDMEHDISGDPPDWRGWGCIIAGVIAFIFLGHVGGLVPATFALVLIAAMGDRDQKPLHALLLALGVTVVGTIIFSYFLQLQFPLFRWG
ncbi:tripartite tricarboxylate transporter TctB family protein [Verticiella sediminum]|uniref:Tripartite tricarboxylate transporter TctB family protein n=1 Tax=Verticiella sediminum TaxID=1247510 RepID=A0A556AMM0_9BURK|nr:tripartite tricarboxylate transporter TctB family protein [Verticiella sediminum]TSH94130.1 tripartite tricarboxylate transporter TctB family protein [Verticiella sediminum]